MKYKLEATGILKDPNVNVKMDISEFLKNPELLTWERTILKEETNDEVTYEVYTSEKSPYYTLRLITPSFIIKRINNIRTDQLKNYIDRYGIPYTDKIKEMV